MFLSESAKNQLKTFLKENPRVDELIKKSADVTNFMDGIRSMAMEYMEDNPHTHAFYRFEAEGRDAMEALGWRDYAAVRILDYLDHAGNSYEDLNLRGDKVGNDPFRWLYDAATAGKNGLTADFLQDMIYLFRQFRGELVREIPSKSQVLAWMGTHPSGLEPEVMAAREKNKTRIIRILAHKIHKGELVSQRFFFPEGLTENQRIQMVFNWWDDYRFHLKFAVRNPDLLNEMLNHSLDETTMGVLHQAKKQGIPFFINPYYLSLLDVDSDAIAGGRDSAIRYYVIYSKQLVDEFGHIVAWEKEDIVEPGKPNAAGWILPTRHNVHRRYPEVAIMIPDTMGRACAGLCASCQRMYDFQRGNLNFNLDKLKPKDTWDAKLAMIMKYWEEDHMLRDILITGGDALMSSNKSMRKILNAVYDMALRKKEKNHDLPDGEKHAEILRVRLGTRLPAYLPQRITEDLAAILAEFKERASKIGIRQFVIQTHFQSAMEITPEVKLGISRLTAAGWTVTNQLVFTAPASRRGHTSRLRQVLNDIGVLPYYTFSVKGYQENASKFSTNARAAQEQLEEKVIGFIPKEYRRLIRRFPQEAEEMVSHINKLRKDADIPFLATDRNVLNLPGVGKSMTYRAIGITKDGRRILEFDHDHTRSHSPIVDGMGKFVIIESKSIANYLAQLKEMGEDVSEYETIWGYSLGETERRMSIYEYPDYDYDLTSEVTNFG